MSVNNVNGGIKIFQGNNKAQTTAKTEAKPNQQSIFTLSGSYVALATGLGAGLTKGLFSMNKIVDVPTTQTIEYNDTIGYNGMQEYSGETNVNGQKIGYGGSVEYNGEVGYSGHISNNDSVGYSGTVTVNHTSPIYENGKLIGEHEITQDININGNKTE